MDILGYAVTWHRTSEQCTLFCQTPYYGIPTVYGSGARGNYLADVLCARQLRTQLSRATLPALYKLGVRLSHRQALCAGTLIKLVFFSPEC